MPILKIRALPQEDQSLVPSAIKKTSLAIANYCNCAPENVWVIWDEIKANYYFEGASPKEIQPNDTHPPLAELTCFEGLNHKSIEELLELTAKTLSENLNIKNNIFITYHEAKSGRVIAGNGIIRK